MIEDSGNPFCCVNFDDVASEIVTERKVFRNNMCKIVGRMTLEEVLNRNSLRIVSRAVNPLVVIKNEVMSKRESAFETCFGEFLERVAYILIRRNGGERVLQRGVDFVVWKNGKLLIIQAKSGDKWYNSSSFRQLKTNFKDVRNIDGTPINMSTAPLIKIIGVASGNAQIKFDIAGADAIVSGQSYWTILSDNVDFCYRFADCLYGGATKWWEKLIRIEKQKIRIFTEQFADAYWKDGTLQVHRLIKRNMGTMPSGIVSYKESQLLGHLFGPNVEKTWDTSSPLFYN